LAAPQVEQQSTSSARGVVVDGLRKLKLAALLQIIAAILAGVSAIMLLELLGSLLFPVPGHRAIGFRIIAIAGIWWIALAVVALILAIVGIYLYLLPSAKRFASWRSEEFSTPSQLMGIGYLWGAIVLLIALLIVAVGAVSLTSGMVLGGAVLVIVGGILLLIGWIGNLIYFFRLRDAFNSTLFLVAAILLIISIFVPILGFIAWILTYVEADSLEKKIATEKPAL